MENKEIQTAVAGKGGWIGFEWDDFEIYVRLDERNGRLGIAELHFPPTYLGHITGQVLRGVPWGSIEEFVNGRLADDIRGSIKESPEATTALQELQHQLTPSVVPLLPLSVDYRLKLFVRNQRTDYGDDFYRELAKRWADASLLRSPAKTIAEANDVSVSTVHRWVKEARRRALLAPARQRKAGPDSRDAEK